jgi:type 2 lantibiotic biosynthesis protein LanM
MLYDSLPSRLLWMLDRTLVLELNVARLQGGLSGSTPQERFDNFVARLGQVEVAHGLFLEYPVLARQVVERAERWLESSLEFLHRLESDWAVLRGKFFEGADPGLLEEVQGGAGDSHRGGRSVILLRFSSGKRIVYKPRSMAIDIHFQEMLAWLNTRGNHPPFRILKVLDRGSHGWVEFVTPLECKSGEEIRRYHRRLGGLLALLYAIGAVDFHFENLIAAGEHPVPIDLEALFHPRMPQKESERPDERLAARVLGESVLRVGLLPYRIGDREDFEGVDLSGVASVAGKPSPDRLLQWEEAGSDSMRAVRKRLPMEGGRNRPTLDGEEVDVADHIQEVDGGFHEVYELMVRNREALLAREGPMARFAGDATRAVLRSTRGYGLLLEDSFHPDFLRDGLDRDRFFDKLWVGLDELPVLERVIRHEHRDLWNGDVPYFSARPDSKDLWTSEGECLPDFFVEPALKAARRRITQMGEEDLRRQRWLTRTALGTLVLNRSEAEWQGYSLADPGIPGDEAQLRQGLLSAALDLGRWFERMAIRDQLELTWVGVDLRNQIWSLFPISEDVYAGTPGIALFLAYLSAVTGDGRYAELARSGMQTLLRRLDHVAKEVVSIGLYQGWGGIVYTLAHLGALWDDAEMLARAERFAEPILSRVPKDTDLDVVAGSAGGLEGLLALYRASGSRIAWEAAVRCGERLLETARPTGGGISWLIRIGGDELQTGFSHGASGIALALLDLSEVAGDARFRQAALGAFEFEREQFWPDLKRWMDEGTRDVARAQDVTAAAAEKSMAMTWCYGAPGVGLARLGALRLLRESRVEEELQRAVAVTLQSGFGKNHSLCHGDLGNLDLIHEAYRRNGDPKLGEAVSCLSRAILASFAKEGWLCGTVGGIEAPGLMNGLAGIGYGLLRLADPRRVPSVLLMEPPR